MPRSIKAISEPAAGGLSRRALAQGMAALLGLLLAGRGVGATDPAATATAVVRNLVEQLLQVIRRGRLDSGDGDALLAVVERETDLSLIARLAMGRYWRQASAAQQADYLALYRSYLLQSFVRRLSRYTAAEIDHSAERFRITGARAVDERDVIVSSSVEPPDGPPLKVDWRLRQKDERPVIIDLTVEGVSLLVTQRSEFGAVLERAGIDGLLAELRARTQGLA